MSRQILITGGAGFIGSHLAERLARRGDRVVVLDDLTTGSLSNLGGARDVEFVHGDASDADAVRTAVSGADAVVHLAAIVSVQRCLEHPELSDRVNFRATETVLEAASDAGVGRVVFASSAAVYGSKAAVPVGEDATPAPESPYGMDKLRSEVAGFRAAADGRLAFTALRLFNVYGPRQDPASPYSGVIARFCAAARAGVAPTVFGDGGQTRDFVHVDDVVGAIVASLDVPVARSAPFNVGTGREVSLIELIETIRRARPMPATVFEPARRGEIRRSCALVGAIHEALGWRAHTTLSAGLEDLLAR